MRGDEAISTMDELTAETVRRIGWQQICDSENPDTLRAQFRQVYESLSRRMQETRLITAGTQERLNAVSAVPQIAALADKMKMPEPGNDKKEDTNESISHPGHEE